MEYPPLNPPRHSLLPPKNPSLRYKKKKKLPENNFDAVSHLEEGNSTLAPVCLSRLKGEKNRDWSFKE